MGFAQWFKHLLPSRQGAADRFAGIQYHGRAGTSQPCQQAVIRLLQSSEVITHARILTRQQRHALLLQTEVGELIAIKSGFSSGYRGEGPSALSDVLRMLHTYAVEIDEFEVTEELLQRLEASALWRADIKRIEATRPVRPSRWPDYVFQEDWDKFRQGKHLTDFPLSVPYAVIDPRLSNLAFAFWEAPGAHITTGYNRLEDIVRQRTGLEAHGSKLFSQAFVVASSRLCWADVKEGEQVGRGNLFTAAFQGYRNLRAHTEMASKGEDALREFLLLNHLYVLEAQAGARTESNESPISPAAK